MGASGARAGGLPTRIVIEATSALGTGARSIARVPSGRHLAASPPWTARRLQPCIRRVISGPRSWPSIGLKTRLLVTRAGLTLFGTRPSRISASLSRRRSSGTSAALGTRSTAPPKSEIGRASFQGAPGVSTGSTITTRPWTSEAFLPIAR